jgi:MYXO-CTERM domain-containing protein
MRLSTRSSLIAAASLVTLTAAAYDARAAAGDDNVSRGNGMLKWETRKSIPGPTSEKLGGSTLQVTAGANLDPLKDPTKPLLKVDMSDEVLLEASWVDDKNITLTVLDAPTKNGKFDVLHTLAPHITVYIDAFGMKLTYDYNAEDLIDYIPGSEWNYLGKGATTFPSWGYDLASLKVDAPALADAQLFSIPFPSIAGSDPLTGTIAINATTKPTFSYQTLSATLEGGKIASKGGSYKIPTTDADYLDIPTTVAGEISYTGSLLIRPSVTITKIGSFSLPFPLVLDISSAGVDLPYASEPRKGIEVSFPPTTFHIPLPNLKALHSLDLGSVKVGETAKKNADMTNTGEMNAVFTAKSSDPQFTVVTSKQTAPSKGKLPFEVVFTPANPGVQNADITITSNDPNEPVQVMKVTGIGSDVPAPAATDGEPDDDDFKRGPHESGCGCKTVADTTTHGGYAALGIALGFAALGLRRRRSPR